MIRPVRVLPSAVAVLAAAAFAATIAVATTGTASTATGGLTIEPAIVQATAAPGRVGGLTVVNSTRRTMRIAVAARPWIQRSDGTVVPDRRRRLTGIGVGARSFTLRAGQRRGVGIRLLRMPAARSLYGSVEVLGTPAGRPRRGVAVRYRLIGALRLDPPRSARRLRVSVGPARVIGRRLQAVVRNRGNTLAPIGGSVRIAGAAGRLRAAIAPARILPGGSVRLGLYSGHLQPGRYAARIELRQGGRRVARVDRQFTVRR